MAAGVQVGDVIGYIEGSAAELCELEARLEVVERRLGIGVTNQ